MLGRLGAETSQSLLSESPISHEQGQCLLHLYDAFVHALLSKRSPDVGLLGHACQVNH